MLAGRHVLSIALVASAVALASGCGSSLPSCGTVSLTFSNVAGVVPDIGTTWNAQTDPVDTTGSIVTFTNANNGHFLVLSLPGPLVVQQYNSAQISYYAGQGGTTTQEWAGGGTVRVESLSPNVKLTFIDDVLIPSANVSGTFTINGSGEWTSGASGCSTQ